MSRDGERDYWVDLSVLQELPQGMRRDAGHRQMGWEEAQAFCDQLPEPERRRLLEQLKRLRLMSGLEEG